MEKLTKDNASTYGVMLYQGTTKLPDPDWTAIGEAIEADHPEELESILHHAVYMYFTSPGNGKYTYYLYFKPGASYTGTQVAQMEKDLQNACDSFYNGLNITGDDFNKELIIHDALLDAMEYDYSVADNHLSNHVAHTAYGALIDHKAVCDGYSKAFKMLLNKAGIECHMVAGLGNNGGHAWNIVKIGGDYYEVDVTWDDQDDKEGYPYNYMIQHEYFNCTTADFKSHNADIPGIKRSGATTHLRDDRYLGYLEPAVANGTAKSYYNGKKVYKVTFDGVQEGAYFYLPYKYTYTYDGRITEMPTNMRLTGCTFDNWYTQKEGGTPITADTVLNGETVAYAHWKGKDVTVTLYLGNGLGSRTLKVQYLGTYGDLPTDFTRSGYIFDGWYLDSSFTQEVTADTKVEKYNNHKLYAKWTAGDYRVSFDANGGSCDTQSIAVQGGASLENLPTPQRYGYDFLGWFDKKEGGNKVTSISKVVEDRTLYAHWQNSTLDVIFVYHNDTDETSEKNIAVGDTYGTLPVPTREGYDFVGWFTDAEGGTQISESTKAENAGNIYIYAHWRKTEYTVTYDAAGGIFSRNNQTYQESYEHDYELDLSRISVPSRDGYTFKGWSLSRNGSSITTKYKLTKDTIFYALWEKNPSSAEENNSSGISENPEPEDVTETGNEAGNDNNGNDTDIQDAHQNQPDSRGEEPQHQENDSANQNEAVSANTDQVKDDFPADGKIENGSGTYHVTRSGFASVAPTTNTKVKSVSVSSEVVYGGTSYKVTEIEKNAYRNCKKLKSVNIGSNIEKIGSNAFKGCKNLKKITIRANNLRSVGGGSFKGIKDGAKITVICKDKKTYQKVVKKLRKAGAKKAKFKFKKG